MSRARIERIVTSGRFRLDGGEWDVDNNVWLLGNDDEVIVIDAAAKLGERVEGMLQGVEGRPEPRILVLNKVDIARKEDLLVAKQDLQKIFVLRRILAPMGTTDAIEFLIDKLKQTKSNSDFFDSMNT